MMAAQPFLDRLVDHPVVDGRGLPAHPTDHADSAHPEIRLKLKVASFTLTAHALCPTPIGRWSPRWRAGWAGDLAAICPAMYSASFPTPRRAPTWACTGRVVRESTCQER